MEDRDRLADKMYDLDDAMFNLKEAANALRRCGDSDSVQLIDDLLVEKCEQYNEISARVAELDAQEEDALRREYERSVL